MRAKFIFRSVKPDGGVATRERLIEQTVIRVGRRAAGDAVELTDPRVPLEAATIEWRDGHAEVGGVGGTVLRVNDAATSRSAVAPGDRVDLGPYRFTIEPPQDGAEFVATIELVQPLEDVAAKMQSGALSLGEAMPSKRSMAWGFVVAILLLFLLIPVIVFFLPSETARAINEALPFPVDYAWTSGEISSPHKSFGAECRACHDAAFVMVQDRTCVACHEDIRHHFQTASFPGEVEEIGRCAGCHKEHEGAEPVVAAGAGLCGDCHADLSAETAQVAQRNPGSAVATSLVDVASWTNHPNFRIALTPIRNGPTAPVSLSGVSLAAHSSNLYFPHALHLKSCGTAPEEWQARAATGGDAFRAICPEPSITAAERRRAGAANDAAYAVAWYSEVPFPSCPRTAEEYAGAAPDAVAGCERPTLTDAELAARLAAGEPLPATARPTGTGRVRAVTCESCHVTEPGGGLMLAVDYEQHCASCHDGQLGFAAGNGPPDLPHGDSRTVERVIRGWFAERAAAGQVIPAALTDGAADPRRRAGEPAPTGDAARPTGVDAALRLAFAPYRPAYLTLGCASTDATAGAASPAPLPGGLQPAAAAVAAPGAVCEPAATATICGTCHVIAGGADPVYAVERPVVVDDWMPRARFSHAAHAGEPCLSCHRVEAALDADIAFMPEVGDRNGAGAQAKGCHACHGEPGATLLTPSPCTMCHWFHAETDESVPLMGRGTARAAAATAPIAGGTP